MADTSLYIPVLQERKKFTDYRKGVLGDSYNWAWVRKWTDVKYVVIHHSVTKPTSDPKSDVDYIARIHKNNGWGGIGYHFVITADGMVWYVGDISTARANVANKNELVIGICMVGDFTQYNPTDEQIISAHDLAKFLINDVPALVNVGGWESLLGHKDLQATACPGTNWKGVSDSVYERIKNRIPYTPQPQPEPVIDWEKRYVEKNGEFERAKADWDKEKKALESAKNKAEGELAKQKVDCQEEIADWKQKYEEAKSLNPKIPSLKEYPDSEVVGRAFEIIVERIKSKIPIFFKK
jgi:hypothetical protein